VVIFISSQHCAFIEYKRVSLNWDAIPVYGTRSLTRFNFTTYDEFTKSGSKKATTARKEFPARYSRAGHFEVLRRQNEQQT
jgi:hypothetical protein